MSKVDTAGRVWISVSELTETMFGQRVPEMERWRAYWGKSVNTAVIENVLYNASQGYLRDLCDLGYETLRADPHLASIVSKRMRAVGSVSPRITPASGDGVDVKLATFYADMVRRQLSKIPRLRQRLINMASSVWYGRAALEIDWVETSNSKERFRAKDLHWIHSRRICLGPERELRVNDGLWQGQGFEKIGFDLREIPFKFITCQRQLFSEYNEREGLLANSLYYSYFKRLDWRERLALAELYGKPLRWIEMDPQTITANGDDVVNKAKDLADDIGSDSAAALPPGMRLVMQSVGQGASAIFKEIIDDCNSELSKLVLGSTNTTDAAPAGLGSEQARVHQDGELLVFTTDCDETAEDLTHDLARAIVHLNGGPEAAELYTPKIELPYEIPPDPKSELERGKLMLEMRLPLKVDELYERGGFTKPTETDEVISELPAPAGGLGPLDGLFRAAVSPSDTSDQNAELQPKRPLPQSQSVQKFSGWRAGRVRLSDVLEERYIHGIPVHIDRPKGFVQRGTDDEDVDWSRTYKMDYGFIPNTAGGDGEGLDVFVGPNPEAKNVYWVKQTKNSRSCSLCGNDRENHQLRHVFTSAVEFDEYKLFIGFPSATAALDCYAEHVPTKHFGGIEQTTLEQVKALLGIEPQVHLSSGDALALHRAKVVLGLIDQLNHEVARPLEE